MAGRPKKQFTPEQIKKINKAAFNQAKDSTIAGYLGIDPDTFKLHFSELTSKKRYEGKIWLLEQQWRQAEAGNPALLCFLGKNYLEQADRQEFTGRDGSPLQIQVIDSYAIKKTNTDSSTNDSTLAT